MNRARYIWLERSRYAVVFVFIIVTMQVTIQCGFSQHVNESDAES